MKRLLLRTWRLEKLIFMTPVVVYMVCRDGFPYRSRSLEQYFSPAVVIWRQIWTQTIYTFWSVFWPVLWIHQFVWAEVLSKWLVETVVYDEAVL